MMPKSTATMTPSSATKRLPGCRSAWKKPSRNTCLKKARAAFSRIARGSRPAATSAARSSMGMPATRSRVSTSRLVRRQSTAGTRKSGSSPKFCRSSEAAAASKRRSISRRTVSASVSTTATGFNRRSAGCDALDEIGEPEEEIEIAGEGPAIFGRSTLTATSAPSDGHGVVHLGDGGGGDRHVVEALEQRLHGLAEPGGDGGAGGRRGKRRQAILQRGEIAGDFLADEIGAGGEHLPELDEAGSQRVQRVRQALARACGGAGARPARHQPGERQQRPGARHARERKERVVAREGQRDPAEPDEIAAGAQGLEHSCLRAASPSAAPRCRR